MSLKITNNLYLDYAIALVGIVATCIVAFM